MAKRIVRIKAPVPALNPDYIGVTFVLQDTTTNAITTQHEEYDPTDWENWEVVKESLCDHVPDCDCCGT